MKQTERGLMTELPGCRRPLGALALCLALTACGTAGPPAPIEIRSGTSEKPTISSTRPAAAPAAPPTASTTPQVFALPEESVAAPAAVPVPMEAIPLAPPAVQDAATFENPALRTIVGQADQAEAAGDLDRARASLERALKIDARNARLWLRLGELNLRAGDPAQALQTAERARELAGSDNALRGLATDLIERAQRAARPAG